MDDVDVNESFGNHLPPADTLRDTSGRRHAVRWFARFPGSDEDWTPRTKGMRGGGWGWDVRCSCGWESRTGGAVERHIRDKVWWHRWEEALLDRGRRAIAGGMANTSLDTSAGPVQHKAYGLVVGHPDEAGRIVVQCVWADDGGAPPLGESITMAWWR